MKTKKRNNSNVASEPFIEDNPVTQYWIGRLISHITQFAPEPRGSFKHTLEFISKNKLSKEIVLSYWERRDVHDDIGVMEDFMFRLTGTRDLPGVNV